MTKLRHESGGRQIDVAPDSVETYESQGWRRVSPKRAAPKATPETASDDAAHEGDD
jgi:hypothetical protein